MGVALLYIQDVMLCSIAQWQRFIRKEKSLRYKVLVSRKMKLVRNPKAVEINLVKQQIKIVIMADGWPNGWS